MAMQSGVGLSKILIIFGAGYTSTVLFKNGKLSDLIGELQSLVKGKESSDGDAADAIAQQVRRLAMEVRHIASARQITVLNGNSGQLGSLSNLVVPATALGVLGYGYMWWKGLSFSDLMYVTKKSMETAVANLTKHLEHVSDVLAETKRHLTQRIENLDEKLDDQIEMSKLIKNEVGDVRSDLSQIGYDLDALQRMVSGLDGKIMSLEDKQDIANMGVAYLINFAEGRKMKVPIELQEKLLLVGKPQGYLTHSETPNLKGLKELAETLTSGNFDKTKPDDVAPGSIDKMETTPRRLLRN